MGKDLRILDNMNIEDIENIYKSPISAIPYQPFKLKTSHKVVGATLLVLSGLGIWFIIEKFNQFRDRNDKI